MKKIGFLGPRGTFCEEALDKYISTLKLKAQPISEDSIIKLFYLLQKNQCSEIIIPFENSVEGPVNTSLDFLVNHPDFHITHELTIHINQCLLGLKKHKIKLITDVVSHPQALGQCQNFFEKHPHINTITTTSTAKAAELLLADTIPYPKEKISHIPAIIGNKILAQLYALSIIKENLNNNLNNRTSFVVLSRAVNKYQKKNTYKTSLVFSTIQDQPGSLYHILGEFVHRNINLTRITSRPTKNKLGEYLFFIDLLGNAQEPLISAALQAIKKKTHYFRLLGSYLILS
jgi:prephenate dehydratase